MRNANHQGLQKKTTLFSATLVKMLNAFCTANQILMLLIETKVVWKNNENNFFKQLIKSHCFHPQLMKNVHVLVSR